MRRSLRRLATAVACAIVALVVCGFLALRALEDRSLPSRPTTIVVPVGATAHEVGAMLASRRVVSSAIAFDVLARLTNRGAEVKAGEFVFPAHASLRDVLREVTGVGRTVAMWVTIPEGFTTKEIAATLAARGLGNYGELSRAFATTSFAIDGTRAPSLEGYLFPDTYLIPERSSARAIERLLTAKFASELPTRARDLAARLGYTIPQIVTVASLVEREAKADDERPLMAGVYYNRLRRGMPLQVDATIEYTFVHHKDTITFADLAIDSPYNTYKHAGLPPTPIANPGRASLLAAFFPKRSDFYYYVYAGNGHSVFARTLAEHEANVARYLH